MNERKSGRSKLVYDKAKRTIVTVPTPTIDTALDHLGDVLYILVELHPDDQCDAYKTALAFYNDARPEKRVVPTGVAEVRLVVTLSG